jgi:hypothetical protein
VGKDKPFSVMKYALVEILFRMLYSALAIVVA